MRHCGESSGKSSRLAPRGGEAVQPGRCAAPFIDTENSGHAEIFLRCHVSWRIRTSASHSQISRFEESISPAFSCAANPSRIRRGYAPMRGACRDLALFMHTAARGIPLQTNPHCCVKSAADIVRNGRMEALPFLLDQRPCGSTLPEEYPWLKTQSHPSQSPAAATPAAIPSRP